MTKLVRRARSAHPAAFVSGALATCFAAVFSAIAVHLHRSFSTLAWDLGIYNQAYWLVSRFGDTFITVRGLDVWAHHVNLVAYLYAPFYWLGAGPEFLVISQAFVLALGTMPVYLIARGRLSSPWLACGCALAYVLYAPLQWLSLADYHPEALVVTPFLFAWYFADRQSWRGFALSALFVIITREDAALPLLLLGALLTWRHRATRATNPRAFWAGPLTVLVCLGYYALCTRLVIPHFNGGEPPYFFQEFYSEWGGSPGRVAVNVITDPARLMSEATEPDRLRFYRDLLAPLGGLSLLALPIAAMCSVQMLGSVIGASPYARMAVYQYTATMIAPLILAAIVGIGWCLRRQRWRSIAVAWVVGSALITNLAWSPSPISTKYREIVGPSGHLPVGRTGGYDA